MEYLQSLAASVNMPYADIALEVGAGLNAFKFLWYGLEKYQNVVIHLGDFHFMSGHLTRVFLNKPKIMCYGQN